MNFYGPNHMYVPVLADQQELYFISSVRIQDIVRKTCQKQGLDDDDKKSFVNNYSFK